MGTVATGSPELRRRRESVSLPSLLSALLLPILTGCEIAAAGPEIVPPDAPGDTVPVSGACPANNESCMAWSADSRTLYLVAKVGQAAASGIGLIAVDAMTKEVRVVRAIEVAPTALVASPTGDLIYSVPEGAGKFGVFALSAAGSGHRRITGASSPEVILSPDGSALGHHAEGSVNGADTIVVLDLSSGSRRASTVGSTFRLKAFSGDARHLLLTGSTGGALTVVVWNTISGAREETYVPERTLFEDAEWGAAGFRLLVRANGYLVETDPSFQQTLDYDAISLGPVAVGWVPGRTATFVAKYGPKCYRTGSWGSFCNIYQYALLYLGPSGYAAVGSVNAGQVWQLLGSPDGQWLAHREGPTPVYLLRNPSP
jgi:hypothetical protein